MRLLPRAESATFLLATQSRPSVNKSPYEKQRANAWAFQCAEKDARGPFHGAFMLIYFFHTTLDEGCKCDFCPSFGSPQLSLPNEDFGRMNKDEIRISKEALYKGVSTRFGQLTIEKSIEPFGFHLLSIQQWES
jgi:hypothetical protein